jgi:membrane-associated phospholipid phosphatase
MTPSTRTALACFVAAALLVAALPLLLPLDDAVYRLIQAARSCDTPWLGKSLGKAVVVMLALAAALVLFRGQPPHGALLLAVFAIASGAACGELLKTICDRPRPDAMPGQLVGNALPSGHVMNTTVIAAALWTLSDRLRSQRRIVAALLFLAVLAQSLSRLLLDAHWASDVVGSVLLGWGWNAAAPALLRLGWWRGLAIGAVATVIGMVSSEHPEIRARLPSVLDAGPPFALDLDFAREEARATLAGDWRFGHGEPIGPVAWLAGSEGVVVLGAMNRSPSWLRIGLRPTTRGPERERGCVVLDISLNESLLGRFSLVRGWRELRIVPVASAWRPDENVLRIHVRLDEKTSADRADLGTLGLRYVRAGR